MRPPFTLETRPSPFETVCYAWLIWEREHLPETAFARCFREAELQLWAQRAAEAEQKARQAGRASGSILSPRERGPRLEDSPEAMGLG